MPINKTTFCLAPWYSINVNADKKLAPCCVWSDRSYNFDQIEQYFTSPELKKVRQDLLSGRRNQKCTKCWSMEDKGLDSERLIQNRTIGRGIETRLLDQIEKTELTNVKYFELALGNLCNLKCVMCSPKYSSQLLAEAELNTELKSIHGTHYKQQDFDWPKKNNFVDWCNKHLPTAIHIKFAGGEPFINPWIQTVIDHIPDEQKKKCVLHFTTNLTIVNVKLFENFRKFKEVWLSVSVEGIGETYDYVRYGHKWETLETNINLVREMNIPNLILKINHVVQTTSYHSIIPMTHYFDDRQLEIYPILCKYPRYLHISSLTKYSKKKFLEETNQYKGFNRNFIQYVRNCSQENLEQDTDLTEQCVRNLSAFDKVRKNSHTKIIPVANLNNV